MNKSLIILFILIAVLASAPYGVGMLLEKQYQNIINTMNTAYAGELKFDGVFSRGYMHSTADTQITSLADKKSVTMHHDVVHGPIILNFQDWMNINSYIPQDYKLALVHTTINSELTKRLAMFYGKKTAYQITTIIDYNGDGVTTLRNDEIQIPIGMGAIRWGGLTVNINHDKDFTNLTTNIDMPMLNYKETINNITKEINISKIHMNLIQHLLSMETIADGSFSSFSINDGKNDVFNLKNADINLKDLVNNNLASSELNYKFDKLLLDQETYGPFSLSFKVRDINRDVLKYIQSLKSAPGKTVDPAVQQSQISLDKIPPEKLMEFLKPQPKLDLNLLFETPKGKVVLVSNFVVGGKDLKSTDAEEVKNSLNGTINSKVDKKLFYALLSHYFIEYLKDKALHFDLENMHSINTQGGNLAVKNSSVLNPYRLSADQLQAKAEAWVIGVLDSLTAAKWIMEKDDKINIDVKISGQKIIINDQERSKTDLDQLEELFTITPEQISNLSAAKQQPADPNSGAPATVQPETKAPATVQPETKAPATVQPEAKTSETVPSN